MNEIRAKIEKLLLEAIAEIPSELKPNLPPGQYTQGAPEWYDFEHAIWAFGERIRQLLMKVKPLRKDVDIQLSIVRIATDEKAKRGRQSFVMLLGYTCCVQHAGHIAKQLYDSCVDGHAIGTLMKMKCSDFVAEIEPFTRCDVTWIRNSAKRYIEKYGNG